MNANKTTELGPIPEVRAYRPSDRKHVTAGGRYMRINNRIFIYGWMPISNVAYVIKHEMLHFILNTFVGGWASHGLDNIAEFGDVL